MTDCQFCGLPANDLYAVYNVMVCLDCTELAEMTYEEEEV